MSKGKKGSTIDKIKKALLRALIQAEVDGNAAALASVSRALLDVEQTAAAVAGGETPDRLAGGGTGIVMVERVVIDRGAEWQRRLTEDERRQLQALRDAAGQRGHREPDGPAGRTPEGGPTPAPATPGIAAQPVEPVTRPRALDDDDGQAPEFVDHEVVAPGVTRPVAADPAATEAMLLGLGRSKPEGKW